MRNRFFGQDVGIGVAFLSFVHFSKVNPMIKGLHHNAYRCRDSEETRKFYEDFLGLELAGALEISSTKTGRPTKVLHTFYKMGDGSFLAFFDDPETPFEFKDQRDFDLHIALEVEQDHLKKMFEIGKNSEMECRGISDHGFIDSIYFRDPNGYVIELTAKRPDHHRQMRASGDPRILLEKWNESKNPVEASA